MHSNQLDIGMGNNELEIVERGFTDDLRIIVRTARDCSYRAANRMQVVSNWLIGWRIVEQEQSGNERAEYGKHIIQLASATLTDEFGKGYSETLLRNYRKFYLEFRDIQIFHDLPSEFNKTILQIQQTVSAKLESKQIQQPLSAELESCMYLPPSLSWSHFERLMRVPDLQARQWYMNEAVSQQWDYRTLRRNIDSQYYYRLVQTPQASQYQVVDEMHRFTDVYQNEKCEFIKNSMLVEFLGFKQDATFTESSLESAIISHIQHFLMEMGKGYAFVSRQQHIHTEDDDYYIDLVFYNYLLKCFVLIDLKTTKITYEDVGQMDMYLKMYDAMRRPEGDNPTIGIILCTETNADVARYSTLASNPQMYASKYLTYLPDEQTLRREIERQKEVFELQNK